MSIKFTVNVTPKPNGRPGKTSMHAREVSEGTYRLDDICRLISERSAVSSANVKSVLDSFAWVMEEAFRYGYHLELKDLGYFSPSLRTCSDGEDLNKVELDGVNFRCSVDLLEKLKKIELKRIKPQKEIGDLEKRKNKMIDYLILNGSISPRIYGGLTGCSRYRAEAELKRFVSDGILEKAGYRNKTLYLLARDKK